MLALFDRSGGRYSSMKLQHRVPESRMLAHTLKGSAQGDRRVRRGVTAAQQFEAALAEVSILTMRLRRPASRR